MQRRGHNRRGSLYGRFGGSVGRRADCRMLAGRGSRISRRRLAAAEKRIAAAKRIADETEDKFLLSEVVPAPSRAEDRLYYEFMLIQGRAAIERAEAAGRDAAEYREYIQEWVHEIKVPITAA